MKKLVYTLFACIAISIVACERDPAIRPEKESADKFEFVVPSNFPQPVYTFASNPLNQKTAELGRRLFYDPILSRDNTISCGSCHQDFAAFANLEHPLSHGVDGLLGTRNSPPIYNLAWHSNFMWDGGINHLESQPLAPITNPVEMDETLANVVTKLQSSPEYRKWFKEAFGDETVNTQLISRAFAQFMAVMISANSKYDKYVRNEGESLTAQEMSGLTIFNQKCSGCHTAPLFTDLGFRNNGLDSVFTDTGREMITNDPADKGKFKVPSLRNIELSSPYMHDGRFTTLEQVLDHYSNGAKYSATIDPLLDLGNGSYGIELTSSEKQDLVAFLKTLTDREFVSDPRFKNPF